MVPWIIQAYFNWVMFALCVLGALLFIKQLSSWVSAPPNTGMPGMWTGIGVPASVRALTG